MKCIRKNLFPFPAGETELNPPFITAPQHSIMVSNQSFILLKHCLKVKAFLLYAFSLLALIFGKYLSQNLLCG